MIGLLGRHYSEFEKSLLQRRNLEKVIALSENLRSEVDPDCSGDLVDTKEKAHSAFTEIKELVDVLINAYDAQLPVPDIMLGSGYVEPLREEDSLVELLTKRLKRLKGSAIDTLRKDTMDLGASAISSVFMQKQVLKRVDPRVTGAMVAFQYLRNTLRNENLQGEQKSTLLYLKQNPLPLFYLQSSLHYGTFVQDAFARRLTFIGQNNPFNKALQGAQAGISNALAYVVKSDEAYKDTVKHFLYAHVKPVEDFLRFKHQELTTELEEKSSKMDSSLWSIYRQRKLLSPRADDLMTTIALLANIKHGDGIFKDLVRSNYDALRDI